MCVTLTGLLATATSASTVDDTQQQGTANRQSLSAARAQHQSVVFLTRPLLLHTLARRPLLTITPKYH